MTETRQENDPRLAYLEAQVDLYAGVTRGEILVLAAYQALRRELVKVLFR